MKTAIFDPVSQGSSWKVEVLAGSTTFLTMSYILFVQPVVLAAAGMDRGAVFTATAVSSALATLLMGILARYPIALAPAMGHNFFFAYTVVLGMGIAWERALGAVCISGCLFLVLSCWGVREKIIHSVPESLRYGIAVGIGLLITLTGMQWGGIVVAREGTIIGLGDLHSPVAAIALIGTLLTAVLYANRVRGAFLIGMGVTMLICLFAGLIRFTGIAGTPPSVVPTLIKLDVAGALSMRFLDIIFIFFFLDLFDTIGTLVGVAEQAGLMKEGRLPRARQALLSDAVGTVVGSLLGTSTVTSYIESAAGTAEGGRTGTANLVTAALFMSSLFFYPLVSMVGEGIPSSGGGSLHPTIAPVLILVGMLMFRLTGRISWNKPAEAIPAYLAIVVIPLTFSITEGIAFGFISASLLSVFSGHYRRVSPVVHVIALGFIFRYAYLAS